MAIQFRGDKTQSHTMKRVGVRIRVLWVEVSHNIADVEILVSQLLLQTWKFNDKRGSLVDNLILQLIVPTFRLDAPTVLRVHVRTVGASNRNVDTISCSIKLSIYKRAPFIISLLMLINKAGSMILDEVRMNSTIAFETCFFCQKWHSEYIASW